MEIGESVVLWTMWRGYKLAGTGASWVYVMTP